MINPAVVAIDMMENAMIVLDPLAWCENKFWNQVMVISIFLLKDMKLFDIVAAINLQARMIVLVDYDDLVFDDLLYFE